MLAGGGLLVSVVLLVALIAWKPPALATAGQTPVAVTVTVHVLGGPPTETPPVPPSATPVILQTAQAARTAISVGTTTSVVYTGSLTSSVWLAWSPDNRTLALAGIDTLVRLLDTTSGRVTFLPGHTMAVYLVAWSPDGRTLASGGADGTVRLWSAAGQPVATLSDRRGLANFAWAADGKLTTLAAGAELLSWQPNGTPVAAHRTTENLYASVAWSPDGQLLAGATDKLVRLWQPDGTLQKTLAGPTSALYTVAWSPDSQVLAAGADDGSIYLWGRDGTLLATLTGHTAFVNCVAWSPDGQRLASAAGDNTVRLWSRDGKPLATLTGHTSAALGVAWSPDGRTLASVGADNTVRLWR